jgi:hypothetical protein
MTLANVRTVVQPCPRCGRTPKVQVRTVFVMGTTRKIPAYRIICCGLRVGSIARSFTIEYWNLRKASPVQSELKLAV